MPPMTPDEFYSQMKKSTQTEDGIPLFQFELGQCLSSTIASDYDLDFDLEEWLRDFVNDAADPDTEFSIEWYPENEIPSTGEIRHDPKPIYEVQVDAENLPSDISLTVNMLMPYRASEDAEPHESIPDDQRQGED